MIDLQGNVKIFHQTVKVETGQLYFDQKTNWFYRKKFKLSGAKGGLKRSGIDFSKRFQSDQFTKNNRRSQTRR
jgi:hypothetical protein